MTSQHLWSDPEIATGIIAIMLGLLVILQSRAISTLSAVTAGAGGVFTGFLLFVGGAFAFGLPFVAMIIFVLAALLALLGIGEFSDLKMWAAVGFAWP